MSAPALRFDGVWKGYPRWTPGTRTLKEGALRRLPTLMRFAEQRWVLRDIAFSVAPGESVGLIGHNGAGKSTLLRLAAGLGRPTRGAIHMHNTPRALLSLGDTFDPTLSGAENAVTTAVIAGLRESEARRRLPAVMNFAQLEAFADAPVRTYSEGMKLRLAMGVAVQVPAPVLLIDEVLAVGDLSFQERCLEHVREQRAQGTALLFASHDLDRIVTECDQALWLSGGTVRLMGPADRVVSEYRRAMIAETVGRTPTAAEPAAGDARLELGRTRFGTQAVTVTDVRLEPPGGELPPGADLSVSMRLVARDHAISECVVAVSLHRRSDGVKSLDANTYGDGVRITLQPGGTTVSVAFEQLALAPGDYHVEVGAYRPDWEYAYDLHVGAYDVRVLGERRHEGLLDGPRRWEVHA